MEVLSIYLVSVCVFGILANLSKKAIAKQLYLKGVFLFAFLYSALRGASVGIDTNTYLDIFDRIMVQGITELPRNTELEIGFMLLNKVLSLVFQNPQIIIIVSSGIICYSFYCLIRKYSSDYMLSSLIFVSGIFTVTMNVMRQYIAMAFIFWAIEAIIKKKTAWAFVWFALAGSMHYTALIMSPLIIFAFPQIEIDWKKWLLISLVSFAMVPIGQSLINVITIVFPQYARFFLSTKYTATEDISAMLVLFFAFVLFLGLKTVLPISLVRGRYIVTGKKIHALIIDKEKERDIYAFRANLLFLLLFVEYIAVYFISSKMWIAKRMLYFVQPSMIIVIPSILSILRRYHRMNRYLLDIINIIFMLYFVRNGLNYIAADPHGVLPYSFFWVQ